MPNVKQMKKGQRWFFKLTFTVIGLKENVLFVAMHRPDHF
jgi:hypothetical protein